MICLLSDQLVPTYLAVKHQRPNRLWRILSAEMIKGRKDEIFCAAVREHISADIELPDCNTFIAQPDRFVSAQQLVDKIMADQPPDTEWEINVTGGNKMMSAGALVAGVLKDAAIFYTEFSAPDKLVDARTGVAATMGASLSVSEFLALYGFEAKLGCTTKGEQWIDFANALALSPPPVNPWVSRLFREAGIKEDKIQTQGIKNYKKYLRPDFLETHGKTLSAAVNQGEDLTGWGYGYVAGKWIETFLFCLLHCYKTLLDLADLKFAVEIKHEGVTNDLDIAFTRGLNFCYVECKSGAQELKKAADQIEETQGTLARLRALRTKALIATTGTNFLDKSKRKLTESAAARLREAGMNILTRPQIIELAHNRDKPAIVIPILKNFIDGRP